MSLGFFFSDKESIVCCATVSNQGCRIKDTKNGRKKKGKKVGEK